MITGKTGANIVEPAQQALADAKLARMPMIGVVGVVVFLLVTFWLSSKARAGAFDSLYATLQIVEAVAGLAIIVLFALNIRGGLQMAGRL